MSTATGINLATVGTAELEIMSEAVFKASLEQMSGEAIARFRRMRKLSSEHRQALEKYLVEHPEKRPGGDEPQPAQAPAKAGKSTNGAGKPAKPAEKRIGKSKPSPFAGLKLRLRAWWEGVDVKDLPLIDARRSKKPLKADAAPKQVPAPPEPDPVSPLDERVELIQKIWGEGFSLPGGDSFFVDLVRNIPFPAGHPCLDVAPGLGGSMRAVANACNLTIEGIERDPVFALGGGILSETLGMTERAPIRSGDPESEKLADRRYAAVFAREALFSFRDRKKFLTSVMGALADGGSLLMTDFVLADRTKSEIIDAWRAAEPRRPSPCTLEEYTELMAELRYEVKSCDDLTAKYVALIQAGWKQLHSYLKSAQLPPEKATMLMDEAELWLARCRALESGRLKLIYIHARMHSGPKRALSDAMQIE